MSNDAPSADPRALLEQERDALRAQLKELGAEDGGGPVTLDYDSGFADTSQVTAERGEAEALVATLREALVEVENALSKLDDGSYGTCEGCSQPIPPARLEAMPSARHCIECASARR